MQNDAKTAENEPKINLLGCQERSGAAAAPGYQTPALINRKAGFSNPRRGSRDISENVLGCSVGCAI